MFLNNIHKTKINFKNRIIKKPKFIHNLDIKLSDTVLVYNDGIKWKIVPIKILLSYPTIYDIYYDKVKSKRGEYIISDITVSYCPYTSCGIIYFGKFIPTGDVYNNNLILADKNKIMLQMLGKLYKNKKLVDEIVRKDEAKIMTLRNAISKYPDCVFLDYTVNKKPIVTNSYNSNKTIHYPIKKVLNTYHPKTLVYVIEYKSTQIDVDNKYTIIVSDDATQDKVNSRDININKYHKYFDTIIEKVREKGGILIPGYWYAWYGMVDAKIVKI